MVAFDERPAKHDEGSVEAAYEKLAPVYDLVYGIGLQHGRRAAMARLGPRAGERILEVGVGTGLSAVRYPSTCRVAAIDLSAPMLRRARARLARHRIEHVSLTLMDAASLAFADGSFDAVYAPYVVNVVPDPVRVASEMLRVCRTGGRLVLLNHFAGTSKPRGVSRFVGLLAARTGAVNWHIHLDAFLRDAALTAQSVEHVNCGMSSLVVCRKP
jgi:phosphatidylethanolamine/phosphatidyl-N-methylethanolamine N-methyltransferase